MSKVSVSSSPLLSAIGYFDEVNELVILDRLVEELVDTSLHCFHNHLALPIGAAAANVGLRHPVIAAQLPDDDAHFWSILVRHAVI